MPADIIIPADLWEEDTEGVITNWLVDDGAMVAPGDLLAEVMTEKVQHEVTAAVGGVVRIAKPADSVVNKGEAIGSIE
jgi:pyruvate/2-oxoglutarate dehydrogenase complex dihydrolipoamide acyltransferase (E2) component